MSGTGGGPSKKYDDPILELVVEITGRASTGITNIEDCDAESEVDTMSKYFHYGESTLVISTVVRTVAK